MSEQLTKEQGKVLLDLAKKTIDNRFPQEKKGKHIEKPGDPDLQEPGASFVTLKIGGKLRGCIGTLSATNSLWKNVSDNAINAAFNDYRFSPLTYKEWLKTDIHLSVLTKPKPLDYSDAIDLVAKLRPGIDGVILHSGGNHSTFLPQVWDQLPGTELFLEHLCLKAGLTKDFWRENKPEIEIYRVQSFTEEKA